MRGRRVTAGLGGILRTFSWAALVPAAASLAWDEGVATHDVPWVPFDLRTTTVVFVLLFAFIRLLGDLLQFHGVKELDAMREHEGFVLVGAAWFILAALSSLPFLLLGATGNPVDAVFESMSGLTTTGATVLTGRLESYPPSLMLWRGLLQWLGGIGIVVVAVAVLAQVTEGGHKILAMEAPGDQFARIQPRFLATARALARIYAGLTALLFGLYLLLMHYGPVALPWSQASYDALLHAFTTMSTGGFSHRTASLAAYGHAPLFWVTTVFMLVAGGSFTLYWMTLRTRHKTIWKSPELRFYLGVFAAAALIISVSLFLDGRNVVDAATHGAFQTASFLTTTGYTSTAHDAFPDSAKLVLLLLMFTGGMSGSTAGGIKTFRILLLLELVLRETQKLLHRRAVVPVKMDGHAVPFQAIRRILVFFFAYLFLFLLGSLAYAAMGLDVVSAFSASAATQGNVGPGLGDVATTFATVPWPGKIVAIVQMWLGRLEIFTVLLLFVPATYRR